MSVQKAYVLPGKQVPQEVMDFPVPTFNPDEVLIRVESAALNPLDWKVAYNGIYITEFPAIVGSDGAGVIVEVGSKVTKFKKGDRVVFQANFYDSRTTTYQQYSAAREHIVAKLPDNIPFDLAIPYPAAGMAAAVAMFKYLGVKAPWIEEYANNNEYILIWGGSTSAGQIAIQLAKHSGLTVITTGSPSNFKRLESLGADYVINYHDADAVDQIKAITGDDLIYTFDITGSSTAQKCWEALSSSKPAKLVTISGLPDVAKNPDKYPVKNVAMNYSIGNPYTYPDIGEGFINLIPKWLEEGKFVPLNTELLEGGLRGIKHGQDQLRSGKVSNLKFIIHPQETI